MKKIILNMEVFAVLDKIRRENRVSAVDWTAACDLKHSGRITELRKMLKLYRAGLDHHGVGRAFTVRKCQTLIAGLKKLIGGAIVTDQLLNSAEKVPQPEDRLYLLVLALEPKDYEQAELFLKALLKQHT